MFVQDQLRRFTSLLLTVFVVGCATKPSMQSPRSDEDVVATNVSVTPPTRPSLNHVENLFGVKFLIAANTAQLADDIDRYVKSRTSFLQGAFDPDCYYRNAGNETCGNAHLSSEVERAIETVIAETQGQFTLVDGSRPGQQRDYGGIAQGAVLEELARKYPRSWFGNFSGDIYIAPGAKLTEPVYITEPVVEDLPWAVVDIDEGWISSSTSPKYGGETHNPRQTQFDFEKIILFAKPEFLGTRIDAWSTALIPGGKKLLAELVALKQFKGQWAYLYFGKDGEVTCSPSLVCRLENPRERTVVVDWSATH